MKFQFLSPETVTRLRAKILQRVIIDREVLSFKIKERSPSLSFGSFKDLDRVLAVDCMGASLYYVIFRDVQNGDDSVK
jgi:hypothetical protein